MTDTTLETVLRRDRTAVLLALLLLAALAWVYVLWLAARMATPDMPMAMHMPDMAAMGPQIHPWVLTDLLFSFAMWTVMMTGMMLPSAAPVILLYARIGRQSQAQGRPLAATGWFAAGYLLAWTGFSLLAALLQAALSHFALLTPELAATSDILGGILLIVAGIYQWLPLKERCLSNCREPMAFFQRYGGFQKRPQPALRLGLRHGLSCIGCCWALMLLLFAGGVMNLAWIAGLAVVVLLEKGFSDGRNVSRLVGAGLVIGGLVLMFESLPI